jgi:hypothetical protein
MKRQAPDYVRRWYAEHPAALAEEAADALGLTLGTMRSYHSLLRRAGASLPRQVRRGVRVVGPDGREWLSMAELNRELGCSNGACYNHADWVEDHWQLRRYPDPENVGKAGGRVKRALKSGNIAGFEG